MLVTFYKIGEVHFRLLGTNGFHVKGKNERYLQLQAHVVVRTSNINFHVVARRALHQKSVPHV